MNYKLQITNYKIKAAEFQISNFKFQIKCPFEMSIPPKSFLINFTNALLTGAICKIYDKTSL
jgi:hypothetical protein